MALQVRQGEGHLPDGERLGRGKRRLPGARPPRPIPQDGVCRPHKLPTAGTHRTEGHSHDPLYRLVT